MNSSQSNNHQIIDSDGQKKSCNLKSIIISPTKPNDNLISVCVSSPTNNSLHINTLKRSVKIPKSFQKDGSKNINSINVGVGKSVRKKSASKSKSINQKFYRKRQSNKASTPKNQTDQQTKTENKCSIFFNANSIPKTHYGIQCKLKINLDTNENFKQKNGAVFIVKQFEQGKKMIKLINIKHRILI